MKTQLAKIHYLDGIRGIAALNVLFTHFIVAFYPAMFTGNASQVHLNNGIEVYLAKSLWTILYAGNISVPMLFVLSAYVLSFRFFIYRDTGIATASAYRRYMRLEIPVLVAMLISWCCMHFGWYYNGPVAGITHSEWWLGTYYQFEPSLWGAVKQALWECFAVGGSVNYNPVLWTMNYEMLGSFSVFGFLALFGKSSRRYIVYGIMALVFVKSYYFAFVVGMILSDMHYSDWGKPSREYLLRNQWISWICIALGILVGSYFSDGRNALFQMMNIQFLLDWGIDLNAFYHIIGASFVLFGCFYNTCVQQVLAKSVFQFFGRIAFSLYLSHFILLCSLGSFLFLIAYQYGFSYGMSVLVSVLITTPVTIGIAYFMTLYVDEPAMQLTKEFQKKYLN